MPYFLLLFSSICVSGTIAPNSVVSIASVADRSEDYVTLLSLEPPRLAFLLLPVLRGSSLATLYPYRLCAMRMASVLTFVLGGVSRYFLNAFTPRVVSRAAVNGTNRRLGTLGSGFGGGFIHHEHRLKQCLGSYPLFSVPWVGSYRGGKTAKAVENFQRRAAISSSGKEVKPKDSKVNLVLFSDSGVCMYVRGVHCAVLPR